MTDTARQLFADLAKALGLETLAPDPDGSVQLEAGGGTVALFPQGAELVIVAPVAPLPPRIDHGTALWLLRRNHYDGDLAPFIVSCDPDATVVLWGRVPVAQLDGKRLAGLVDALGATAAEMRDEISPSSS